MQKFNNQKKEGRILNIVNMNLKDAEEYYKQISYLKRMIKIQKIKVLKERIKQNNKNPNFYEWILAVKSREEKVVGKIEVLSMGNNVGFVTISVVDNGFVQQYGVEAIEEFVEICKENKYFSVIELDKKNKIMEEYRKLYNQEIEIKLG